MPPYSPEFRQRARIALTAAGYPSQRGALLHISRMLGIPRHTLKRWYHQPEPPTLTTPSILQPMLSHEVQQVFASLDRKRESANYAELSRALTQLVDALHAVDSHA
jgi:hypothetical protein